MAETRYTNTYILVVGRRLKMNIQNIFQIDTNIL